MHTLDHSHRAEQNRSDLPGPPVLLRVCRWIAVSALLWIAGCGVDKSPAATRDLQIAINPWPGYSFMYLAEEQGYFRDEGLSVRLIELASLADARRVFEQGQSDFICCTLVEVMMINDAAPI